MFSKRNGEQAREFYEYMERLTVEEKSEREGNSGNVFFPVPKESLRAYYLLCSTQASTKWEGSPRILYRIHSRTKMNKRLSQQPVLGAFTFLRSFVAGKANFCSHLLASLVRFTVVKSQAILIIRLGVTEVIYHSSWGHRSYFRRNFISSASFKKTKFLPRWICSGTTNVRVDFAYRSSLCQQRCVCIM